MRVVEHYFIHLCFSCKDTVSDKCGDGNHSLQKAEIRLSMAIYGTMMATNQPLTASGLQFLHLISSVPFISKKVQS